MKLPSQDELNTEWKKRTKSVPVFGSYMFLYKQKVFVYFKEKWYLVVGKTETEARLEEIP